MDVVPSHLTLLELVLNEGKSCFSQMAKRAKPFKGLITAGFYFYHYFLLRIYQSPHQSLESLDAAHHCALQKNPAFKYVDPISWNNLQKELKLSELVTFENVTSLCLWVGLTTFNV